ncbi:MFS transporter (plasmid) [Variovorax sp. 375MFSha3.1]|uniref:MFS transporter n=1 Tax=unclassified Variovorax TaxID=663243 RepID=UPI003AAD0224
MKSKLVGLEKCAVLYLATLGWLPNYLLPYDVMTAMKRFSLTEDHVGWLASAQLLVLSLTALLMSRRISRLSKRTWSMGACFLGFGATAAMIFAHDLYIYAALKIVFGVAAGVLVACVYGLASYYEHPEKWFAQAAIVIAVVYGIAMYIAPLLIGRYGPTGAEIVQLAMMALGLVLSPKMPVASLSWTTSMSQKPTTRSIGIVWMLIAVFALFISQSVTISFAGPSSHSLMIDDEKLGLTFTIAALIQIPAAVLTNWMGNRAGAFKPIYWGLAILIGTALGMYEGWSRWGFFVALGLINAGVVIANPYLLSVLAELDETGESAALAGSVTNFGLAIGPALASVVFGFGGVRPVGWVAAGLLVLAILTVFAASRSTAQYGRTPPLAKRA